VSGCQSGDGCAAYKHYIESVACSLVILKQNHFGREYSVEGYNPTNKRKVVFEDTGGLYITIRESVTIGDTLVKLKSKPYFLLKKKQFNIKFEIKCDGDISLLSPADTIPKS
jgi:hypothetical protein